LILFAPGAKNTTEVIMNYKAILSDQVLFAEFKKGDERAFMEVYQTFKKVMYAFIIRIVGTAEDAEDLTVQTFIKIWERRENMECMAHLKNFLFVTARNGSIDFLQSKRRSHLALTTELAEEIDNYDSWKYNTDQLFTDLVEDIKAIIEKMSRLRGRVFRMRYLEERSVNEVADTLGLSVQSVYWHTKEALAQTRAALLTKSEWRSTVFFLLFLLFFAQTS
jgi:RNA polymerase sigma factor (sigma-70 family)